MSITNNPIILDSTGQALASAMQRRNSLVSMIAEDYRSNIYADISQIAAMVRNGYGARAFPIGDQIIVPWKDMDDENHNTTETAYQVKLNVVHHGHVKLESGETVPGMFVQWHHCSPYGVQLSNYQIFKNCPDGLPAGTYSITLGATWGSKSAVANTSWCFTLTQAVPAGGCLSGFEGMPDNLSTAWRVKSWASKYAATPIETVTVSALGETVATSLGTMNLSAMTESGLNGMHQVGCGHNRWKTSALRQYLNASGENWWSSQEDFDIRPNEYAKKGFMTGFDQDFLDATRKVEITNALNTVEGFASDRETTFDRFFIPSIEQMYIVPQLAGAEGDYFEYWKRRVGRAAPVAWYSTLEQYKHYAINAQTESQYVRLRSAHRDASSHSWYVNSSGYVSSYYAFSAYRFSPVCVVA